MTVPAREHRDRAVIFLHGKPGSGKTRAAADAIGISRTHRFAVLSVGNHLRALAVQDIETGYRADLARYRHRLNNAEPLPNKLIHAVIEEYFDSLDSSVDVVVLDGYPRYAVQLQHLESSSHSLRASIRGAVHVDVDDAVAVSRIVSRGTRNGERTAGLAFARARVSKYCTEQASLDLLIGQRHRFIRVSGMQPKPAVGRDLYAAFSQLLEPLADA